jgi:TolB protein
VTIDPQWAPDGTKIAYVEFDQEGYPWHHTRIVVADLASGATTTLVDWEGVSVLAPRWSPDGKRLAFTSDRAGWANIWTIDLAGGDARHMVEDTWEHAEPTWAPDGLEILFDSDADGDLELYVREFDGTRERRLTDNTVDDYAAIFAQ